MVGKSKGKGRGKGKSHLGEVFASPELALTPYGCEGAAASGVRPDPRMFGRVTLAGLDNGDGFDLNQ